MALILVAVGLAMLLLPGMFMRFGAEVGPKEWARAMGVSLLAGLFVLQCGLVLASVPLMFAIGEAKYEPHGVIERHIAPGGPLVQALCLVGAVLVAGRCAYSVARMLWLRRLAYRAASLGQITMFGEVDAVVVPSRERMAFALERGVSVPVVTSGLVELLSENEIAAVVSHEQVHLRHRHSRFLGLAEVVNAALPFGFGSKSAVAMHLAVERWADEESTARSDSWRTVLERALRSIVDSSAVSPELHKYRLAALGGEPVRATVTGRTSVYGPMVVLGVAALALMTDGVGHVEVLVAVAFGA
jgi:Zn-dependent protease with chaperone function